MRYVDEFRNKTLVHKLADNIKKIYPAGKLNIMEVCGTHTQNFLRFGLNKLLPQDLHFIAGPGCPVCVSPAEYIDAASMLAGQKDVIILTFGDMLRIPGSATTLEQERAVNGNVRVVYSAFDSIGIAKQNPGKKIVFLAVGFETTAPTVALSILGARKEKLKNISFLTSLKLIPPVMYSLAQDKKLNIQGFLCPGHVSAVIGTRVYEPIAKKFGITCCVAGFEPVDILEGIYLILRRIRTDKPAVDNQYCRVVKTNGNTRARAYIRRVFEVAPTFWRGLGVMPASGLVIKNEFARFDAASIFPIVNRKKNINRIQKRCRCGDILKGVISPQQCPLFSGICSPENPVGPCMVSSEGACNAYFKYRRV